MSAPTTDPLSVTAVILAGGMSRRLGRNKAIEPFEGEPLIRRVIARMKRVARDVIVVANDEERISELDLPDDVSSVVDQFPAKGPLGGIITGLDSVATGWAAFCACDMPFLNPKLYHMLLAQRSRYDAIVPVIDDRPEPTHAIYSRACIEPIRERISADDLKVSSFFDYVRVRLVPEMEIRASDPNLLSFYNINTQHDLDAAILVAEQESKP